MSKHVITIRAADFVPTTLDEAKRTVEAVLTTGAAVDRFGHTERLSTDKGAVNLEKVKGRKLLNSHRQDDIADILGVIEEAWFEPGKVVARILIAEGQDTLIANIKAGVITGVSIGYQIIKFVETTDPESGHTDRLVVEYEIIEASAVAVPADDDAKFRSKTKMPTSAAGNQPAPTVTPPVPVVTRAAINTEVRALCEAQGLDTVFADSVIDADHVSIEAATVAVSNEVLKRHREKQPAHAPRIETVVDHEEPAKIVLRMAQGQVAKLDPNFKLPDDAKQYAAMELDEVASECMTRRGQKLMRVPRGQIFERAATTSDYPQVVAAAGNIALQAAYAAVPVPLKSLAQKVTVPNMAEMKVISFSDAGTLDIVNEHAEIKRGYTSEGSEKMKPKRYAKIFPFTQELQSLGNLSPVLSFMRGVGRLVAETEGKAFTDLLNLNAGGGPKMSDTQNLFHASHSNLAASATALSEASLTAAYIAFGKQKSESGGILGILPDSLVVPIDLMVAGQKLLTQTTPANAGDISAFAGKLNLVPDPRLTSATRWYLAASKGIESLVFGYLEGTDGPIVDSRAGWEIDGIEIRVRVYMALGFMNFRGWYANPGA